MNALKSNKGFSLIELMIAVVIIGVLAAIAIPNYQKYQRKARQAEAKSTLAAMYTSAKSFQAEYGGVANDLGAIGYAPEGRIIYNCGWTDASTYPARYPATANRPGRVDTLAACAAAVNTNCADGTADLGAAATGITNSAIGAQPAVTFTIGCAANLGGVATDRWTIDNGKSLSNRGDGT